jgi:hypothetical protein
MFSKPLVELCAAAMCASLLCGCGRSPSADPSTGNASGAASGPVDACSLFSSQDIAAIVGNPVEQGQPFAGPEVCKWNAEPGSVTALVTVRRAGSDREKVLCGALGEGPDAGQRVEGVGRIATWKFSNTAGLFNSGDLEACGGAGYVSVTLNGKTDETALKTASIAIARKVFEKV